VASRLALESLEGERESAGWGVSEVELTFGLKLGFDAGVIVSKMSSEASLEVKITASRS
jgi:hypothetical protein